MKSIYYKILPNPPFSKEGISPQLITLLLLFLLLVITSCATWEGRGYKRGPSTTKTPGNVTRTGTPPPAEKEVKKPEGQQYAMLSSPARSASMEQVVKGKKFLAELKYDRALSLFQEAVVIDSANGVAYYYMAKTRFQMDQNDEALGILEKAESLLSSSDEWKEAISLLRMQIQTSKLSSNEAKESDLIPIINKRE